MHVIYIFSIYCCAVYTVYILIPQKSQFKKLKITSKSYSTVIQQGANQASLPLEAMFYLHAAGWGSFLEWGRRQLNPISYLYLYIFIYLCSWQYASLHCIDIQHACRLYAPVSRGLHTTIWKEAPVIKSCTDISDCNPALSSPAQMFNSSRNRGIDIKNVFLFPYQSFIKSNFLNQPTLAPSL